MTGDDGMGMATYVRALRRFPTFPSFPAPALVPCFTRPSSLSLSPSSDRVAAAALERALAGFLVAVACDVARRLAPLRVLLACDRVSGGILWCMGGGGGVRVTVVVLVVADVVVAGGGGGGGGGERKA